MIVQSKQSPMSRQLGFLVALLGFLFLPACSPLYYKVEPVEFRIVDSETGEPIKEAFVSVRWGMKKSTYEGWGSAGDFAERFTSSDDNGNVYISGWYTGIRNILSTKQATNSLSVCRVDRSGYVSKTFFFNEVFADRYAKVKHETYEGNSEVIIKKLVGGLNGTVKLDKLPLEPKERYITFNRNFHYGLIASRKNVCNKDSAIIQHGLIKQVLLEESLARNAGIYTYYEIPRDATGQFTTDEVEACKTIAAGERYSDDKCVVGDYCRKPMRPRE